MVNYFDVLGLSIQEIDGRDEATIAQSVDAAHKKLYARTVGSYANVPRKDGRTQAQWQVILNEARDTLKDPQKRRQHIADLPETKKAVEQKKEANLAAVEQAVKKVLEPAVKFVVKHAEIISAIGITLILLGAALADYFEVPIGTGIYGLGAMILPSGGTAFLYKGSRRRIMIFGAAGIILIVLGSVFPHLMLAVRLGYMIFMCGLMAFLFKQSWHLKIMEVARRATAWWMAWTATWNPVIRVGATAWVLALTVLVFAIPLSLLSGGVAQVILGPITELLFTGGLPLITAGFLWWLIARRWDILECQGCRTRMTRKRFHRSYRDTGGCPACGSDLDPVPTGKRQSVLS